MIANYDQSPYVFALTDPELEAVTVVLDPSITYRPWRVARRRLTTALRTSLHEPVKGWRVRRVRYLDGIVYDLLPPDGSKLTSKQAWSLTHALETLPDVVDADPSFFVRQDVVEKSDESTPMALSAPVMQTPGGADLGVDPCEENKPPDTLEPHVRNWSALLVDAPCAWQLTPPQSSFGQGKTRGEGIRVGHPDSGYLHHEDFFFPSGNTPPHNPQARFRTDLEKDYVDKRSPVWNIDGDHGLSTGSIIVSSDTTGNVHGIAPEAEIVPLRVTRRRLLDLIPAPILFWSGSRALRDAILYATNVADCHVISISLGWFRNKGLHEAIKDAVSKDVIVCAAAGNYTVIVAWPAAYSEVVAVAGCNSHREKWRHSASGPEVTVTAPAEDVWVPSDKTHPRWKDKPDPHQGSGTSFAVATVAGVAALWLAYHGRDFLLDRYHGQFSLSDVFRYVLSESSDPFADPVGSGFGAGIVNARRVLLTPLPSIATLQVATPAALPAAALATPAPSSPVDRIGDTFPEASEGVLRPWLAAKLNVEPAELDQRIVGMEDELIFHIATNPALRAELASSRQSVKHDGPAVMATPAPESTTSFSTVQFSDQLQSQLVDGSE